VKKSDRGLVRVTSGVLGLGVVLGVCVAPPAGAAATKVTNVIVQGGTTPTDSGLLQAVIEPGFKAAYPQYNLEYVSVGTGQAITNAEAGQADAVFTHSATLEASFVSSGYSYEPGGRLVMSSDFVTVGATSDPAGVASGTPNDVTAAFQEIATAGAAGTADFVSRGDASGTNVKELAIWKQTSVPLNTLGEPGTPGTTNVAPWYHITGDGQGANLQVTDQCPFSSGACYTIADRGTFNALVTQGVVPDLEVVSQNNSGPGAIGGPGLLANPYHAYAVNPQKEPGVHINLAGALAFLNYLTSTSAQAAIGAYPSAANPAFIPDARPVISVTQKVPSSALATATVTVSGTVKPAYSLDPPLTGQPLLLERKGDPGTVIATTHAASDGSFSFSFSPTRTDSYLVYAPQFADGIVGPPFTSFRQATSKSAGTMTVHSVVTFSVSGQTGDTVSFSGTASPTTNRISAAIQIQGKPKGATTYQSLGSPIALPNGQSSYTGSVLLPSAGKWTVRAEYTDPGAVANGFSTGSQLTAP
jgi:tungstate transport system substrate-binding protein